MIKVILKLFCCLQAPASAAEGTEAAAAGAEHAPEEGAEDAAAAPRNAPEGGAQATAAAGPQDAPEGGAANDDPALEGVPPEVMGLVPWPSASLPVCPEG